MSTSIQIRIQDMGCVHRPRIRNRRITSDWRVFWDSRPDLTNPNLGKGLGCVHRLRIRNRRFTSDWRVFWDSRPDLTNLIGVCFGTLGACDPMLPLFRADTPHACTCGKTGFEYLYPIIFNRETEHELWDLWSLGSGGPGFSWYIIMVEMREDLFTAKKKCYTFSELQGVPSKKRVKRDLYER